MDLGDHGGTGSAHPLGAGGGRMTPGQAVTVGPRNRLEVSTPMASRREDHADGGAARRRSVQGDQPDEPASPEPALQALRRLDISSSLSLLFLTLLLFPVSFGYASVLAYPFGRARVWLVIGFFLLGLCLLLRPIEARVMKLFFHVRKPTEQELERLRPIWLSVLSQADISGDRYVLAIDDSAEPNALAVGGHVIAVTLGAMHLSDHELEGILAHELGHHLGFHPLALTASFWLSLPLVAVGIMVNWLLRVTSRGAVAGWFLRIPLLTLLSLVVGLLFALFARFLNVILWFTRFMVNLIGRSSEYAADHAAVQLGFGDGLLTALETHAGTRSAASGAGVISRWLWATHPPLHKRIQRIKDVLTITGE
jgi:Zn-dependent protease with chaperone function